MMTYPDKHDFENAEDFDYAVEEYKSRIEDRIRSNKEDAIVEAMDNEESD